MRLRKKLFRTFLIITYLCSFALIFTIANHTSVDTYIQTIKQINQTDLSMETRLLQEIEELAKQIDEPSINAKIDRVWQAIPGYNGLRVDREQSLQFSKQVGEVNLQTLFIQEIEPEVSLTDLPPHPIYRGNPKKPNVSMMVNVAWGTEFIEDMLGIFDQYQIKATFFLDGKWLKDNQELALKIVSRGHEIGNHAYSHPDLSRLSASRVREEIMKTEEFIHKLGVRSYVFAPPAGAYDQRVVQIAAEYDLQTVLWTLDTLDWQKPSAETIVKRIVPHLENGSLILMHPTQSTVEALPEIIEGALGKGLLPVTVSELISPARSFSIERLK